MMTEFKTNRTGLLTISLALALAACLWGCGKAETNTKSVKAATVQNMVREDELTSIHLTENAEDRLGIETAVVEYRTIHATRTVGATVIAPSGRSIAIASPVAGLVLAPESEQVLPAGSRVTTDTVVFRLQALPPETDLLSATEDLAAAKARFSTARAKAQRASQLLRDKAGSVREEEEANSALATARADLKNAQARADMLGNEHTGDTAHNGSALTVTAPINGVLQAVHVAPGQRVAAGTPLFQVVAQQSLWVQVPLYAGDLAAFELQQPAMIYALADHNRVSGYPAQPVTAPPGASALYSSVDVFFEIPNEEEVFRPGEKVYAQLQLQAMMDSATLPLASILYDINGNTWVYEQRGPQVYTRKRVEVRSVVDQQAVLSRGPAAGTRVVTAGAAELFGTEFGSGK